MTELKPMTEIKPTGPQSDVQDGTMNNIRVNNLVLRIVNDSLGSAKVEVAEVYMETKGVSENGGIGQRSVRVSEWREPTDAEREAFEALAWA